MKEKQVIDTDNLKAEPQDSSSHSESKEKTVDNKYSDNQYFGCWYSYKTTHSIIINGTPKQTVPQMYERIQLVKPFEITPVPKDIKK